MGGFVYLRFVRRLELRGDCFVIIAGYYERGVAIMLQNLKYEVKVTDSSGISLVDELQWHLLLLMYTCLTFLLERGAASENLPV